MNRRHPLSSAFQSACCDSFRRSARFISSDLFDDTSCQTAGRAQFRAPSPQTGQQRLAFGIDEGHACQIDHHAPLLSDGYPTKTGAQLIDPWTGQASLESEQGSVRFRASLFSNLQHVRWALFTTPPDSSRHRHRNHTAAFNRKRMLSQTPPYRLLQRTINVVAVCSYSFGFPEFPSEHPHPLGHPLFEWRETLSRS